MNRYSCSIIVLVILYHCPGLFSQARQKEDQSCTPTKVSSEGRTRIPGTHTGPPCELFFDTPENRRNCAAAIQQLRAGADNPEASPDAKVADLKALASLYRGTKDHKNAIATYQEAIRITSARPELYVSLAGVVWQDSYDKIAKLKVDLRLRLGEPYPPDPRSDEACRSLSATTLPNINELGIGSLEKALLLEPDNSDAMFYMGQFYVLKADLQCGDSGAGKEALQIAENWRHKAEEIRARISGSAAQFTPPRQEANNGIAIRAYAVRQDQVAPSTRVFPAGSPGLTDPVPEVIVPVRPPDGVSDVALTAVVLRIVVDEHGSVVAISLVQGSPSAVPAVIEAIRKRKYKPGLIDGRPVRVSMVVEIAANEIVTQQSR